MAAHPPYCAAFLSAAPLVDKTGQVDAAAEQVRTQGCDLILKIMSGTAITAEETKRYLRTLKDAGALEAAIHTQQDAAELLQKILDIVQVPPEISVRRTAKRTRYADTSRVNNQHMFILDGLERPRSGTRTMSEFLAVNGSDTNTEGDNRTEVFSRQFEPVPERLVLNLNRHGYDQERR